jgi:hypothetical protein
MHELVIFEWFGETLRARVAWVRGHYFGLALINNAKPGELPGLKGVSDQETLSGQDREP